MGTTRKWAQGRGPRALTTALVLAVLAALLLAGAAEAAKPGKPTAKTPKGTIATTRPTFKWSKAARSATYEVRAYEGSRLLVKKTGIRGLKWTSSTPLPRGATLTWEVRGRKAGVNGPWSSRRTFTVAALSSAKAITAFSFQGLTPAVTGVVDETLHTVALTVPYGSVVSALVPTITTTGASVSPASGVAHDFTSPVTYTVIAADATTQPYTVSVTVGAPVIGQSYGGGKIAYILQEGDPGYAVGQTRGLIAATVDQSTGIMWATESYWSTSVPSTGTALGTGAANTDAIITQNGAGSTYAAGLARACTDGGYSDWYLPSQDELNKLYLNRAAIGGFATVAPSYYWSSSEYQGLADNARTQVFDSGYQGYGLKYLAARVRAVRAF